MHFVIKLSMYFHFGPFCKRLIFIKHHSVFRWLLFFFVIPSLLWRLPLGLFEFRIILPLHWENISESETDSNERKSLFLFRSSSAGSTAAAMEGKLKEKLESIGLALLCLSTGHLAPFEHWCKLRY